MIMTIPMKKLVTVRNLEVTKTLTITKIFPAITMTFMRPRIITDTMTVASLNLIEILEHIDSSEEFDVSSDCLL